MVVFIVLAFFAAFMVVDLVQARRQRAQLAAEGRALHEKSLKDEPHWVAGYQLPERFHYHQGHTWVHWVAPDQAYVGVDDFARRLMGKSTEWTAPSTGTWVRQGEPSIKARHNGDSGAREVPISSPVSGEIIATNPRLKKEKDIVHRESYGNGWLFKIRSPRLAEQFEGLLQNGLAARWMEGVRDSFQNRLVMATGNVVQDGGVTVDSLDEVLGEDAWAELVDDFLAAKTSSL